MVVVLLLQLCRSSADVCEVHDASSGVNCLCPPKPASELTSLGQSWHLDLQYTSMKAWLEAAFSSSARCPRESKCWGRWVGPN